MFSRTFRLVLLATFLTLCSNLVFAGVKLGTISIGVGYVHAGSCCYDPYYDYGFLYGPYWWPYGAYYPPGYFTNPSADKGTVKLVNAANDADVYIDNAYAGKAGDLKKISIEPGAYNLELRAEGKEPVQKRVYVLSGKTVKLEF